MDNEQTKSIDTPEFRKLLSQIGNWHSAYTPDEIIAKVIKHVDTRLAASHRPSVDEAAAVKAAAESGVFCTMPQAVEFARRVLNAPDRLSDALPPLPLTNYNGYADGSEPLYTTEHMRDYANAAIQSFDAWLENPYTKVLQKSIREDYVPRCGPQPAPDRLSDANPVAEVSIGPVARFVHWLAEPHSLPHGIHKLYLAPDRSSSVPHVMTESPYPEVTGRTDHDVLILCEGFLRDMHTMPIEWTMSASVWLMNEVQHALDHPSDAAPTTPTVEP